MDIRIEENNVRNENDKKKQFLRGYRRKTRRIHRIEAEIDDIVQFFNVGQHKRVLDQMGQLIGKVRKVEKYHENRVYIPRLQEGEDADGAETGRKQYQE